MSESSMTKTSMPPPQMIPKRSTTASKPKRTSLPIPDLDAFEFKPIPKRQDARDVLMSPQRITVSPHTLKREVLIKFSPSRNEKEIGMNNLETRRVLGYGFSGSKRKSCVIEVAFKDEQRPYALKTRGVIGPRERKMQTDALLPLLNITHPNLLKHHLFWQEDGKTHLLTELCDNLDLYNFVEKVAHPISESDIVEIAYQISAGLTCLHKNGYIHRDIKPQNIFVTSDGLFKVGDFGIMTKAHERSYFSDGDAMYIPPELVGEFTNDIITPAIDMFALGLTLYELSVLPRALPPSGMYPSYYTLRDNSFEFPADANIVLSDEMKSLIRNMMKADPAQRISAEEVLALPMMEELRKKYPHAQSIQPQRRIIYRTKRRLFASE